MRGFRFLRLFARRKPSAVLIFASGGGSFLEKSLYSLYTRLRGARSLFFVRHGGFIEDCRRSRAYAALARILLSRVSILLCQSEAWEAFYRVELHLESIRKEIIPNWTVTPALLAVGNKREYAAPQRMTILFLGWLEPTKGIRELLSAYECLCRRLPTAKPRLVLAGEGSMLSECRAWALQRSEPSDVEVPGWVEGEAKLQLLARADVFVLPSHFEGLSNAMLEAMAAGMPVVVTKVGSLPDVATNGVHGFLIEPRDAAALAERLHVLITDSELRKRLGHAAHQRAADFGVESAVAKLVRLLQA